MGRSGWLNGLLPCPHGRLTNAPDNLGHTFPNLNRQAVDEQTVCRDSELCHQSAPVERPVEVEDEVAETVEYGAVPVDLHVLGRVRMVPYHGIGTCIHQHTAFMALH